MGRSQISEAFKRKFEKFIEKCDREEMDREIKSRKTPPPEDTLLTRDPMSPYEIPHSYKYRDISDIINYQGFMASYPQSYVPISDYCNKFGVRPLYDPPENEDYSRGVITIAGMIDLVSLNEPLELHRFSDFDTIIHLTENYLEYLDSMIRSYPDKSYQNYRDKTIKFLNVIQEARTRACRYLESKVDDKSKLENINSSLLWANFLKLINRR